MRSMFSVGIAMACLAAPAIAAELRQAADPAIGMPTDRVEREADTRSLILYRLDVAAEGSKGEKQPFRLTLFCRDGVFTGGWKEDVFGSEGAPVAQDKNGGIERVRAEPEYLWDEEIVLGRAGDVLKGRVGVGFPLMGLRDPLVPPRYEIEAKIVDGALRGTVTPTASAWTPKKNGPQTPPKWALIGRIIEGDAMEKWREHNALAEGASWSRWTGPDMNGQALLPEGGMLEHCKFARLAWVSEARFAAGGGGMKSPHPFAIRLDYNGPLLAEGRIILSTVERSAISPQWNQQGEKAWKGWREGLDASAALRRYVDHSNTIIGDFVIYCMDAVTGQTLWTTRLKSQGCVTSEGKGKRSLWSTGVIDGGVFYCMGITGRVFALGLGDGALLWESAAVHPKDIATFEEALKGVVSGRIKQPATGKLVPELQNPAHIQCSLCLCDGVLVCPSKEGGRGEHSCPGSKLVGLDAATGKRLWGPVGNVKAGHMTPFEWVHDGKAYVLTGRACLDPRTGEVLWRIPDEVAINGRGQGVVVGDDTLVLPGGFKSGESLRGYRITPEQAEHLWTLPLQPAASGTGQRAPYGDPGATTLTVDPARGYVIYTAGHSGEVLTVDAKTGKRLSKSCRIGLKYYACGNALMGDRYLDAKGAMVRVGKDGSLASLGALPGLRFTCTSPAYADGRVFFRGLFGVVCYDIRAKAE